MNMKDTINFNLLRHAVSTQMFCGRCGRVLDVNNSVLGDIFQDENHVRLMPVTCGKCWDGLVSKLIEAVTYKTLRLEVTDGRTYTRKGMPKIQRVKKIVNNS